MVALHKVNQSTIGKDSGNQSQGSSEDWSNLYGEWVDGEMGFIGF